MFGLDTKVVLSLAALATLISGATAYYNGTGGFPPQEFEKTTVHGAPGPEMGVTGVPAALAVAYGLYLVARRRKQK
jgi:hypothetical protein